MCVLTEALPAQTLYPLWCRSCDASSLKNFCFKVYFPIGPSTFAYAWAFSLEFYSRGEKLALMSFQHPFHVCSQFQLDKNGTRKIAILQKKWIKKC